MPLQNHLLIVVADGGNARFLRPVPETDELHSSSRVMPSASHKYEASHSDAATHHAPAPRHDQHSHDPQAHEKTEFALWIAAELDENVALFDQLVLVAPAHVNNIITSHLSAIAATKLIGQLYKDLTTTPDHELSPHLRAWLRPVHREPLL